MVASDTGRVGIIRRARESGAAPRIRYTDARQVVRAYLADHRRDRNIIASARDMFEQRSEDPSLSDFLREDAALSIDVLDSLVRMENVLGGIGFTPAPARQANLQMAGVDVSVNLDLLITREHRSQAQIGGALFRFTKADDESELAASRRRNMGLYAATLVQMQVRENLAGNRRPYYRLCMSVDVQCEEAHIAPRTYAQRQQNLENACRFISAMWHSA